MRQQTPQHLVNLLVGILSCIYHEYNNNNNNNNNNSNVYAFSGHHHHPNTAAPTMMPQYYPTLLRDVVGSSSLIPSSSRIVEVVGSSPIITSMSMMARTTQFKVVHPTTTTSTNCRVQPQWGGIRTRRRRMMEQQLRVLEEYGSPSSLYAASSSTTTTTTTHESSVPLPQCWEEEVGPILRRHLPHNMPLWTIDQSDLPVVGEIYAGGRCRLCLVIAFKVPSSLLVSSVADGGGGGGGGRDRDIIPPLLEVLVIDSDDDDDGNGDGYGYGTVTSKGDLDSNDTSNTNKGDAVQQQRSLLVDLGQITTFWPIPTTMASSALQTLTNNNNNIIQNLSKRLSHATKSIAQDFPINHVEASLEELYDSRRVHSQGRQSGGGGGLTKKQLTAIASNMSTMERSSHLGDILRKVLKAGGGGGGGGGASSSSMNHLLVNSDTAVEYLYQNRNIGSGTSTTHMEDGITRRLLGAMVLGKDATLAGRFKRASSIFISAAYDDGDDERSTEEEKNGNADGSTSSTSSTNTVVRSITVLNGGWITVDKSVRACTEARMFADRTAAAAVTATVDASSSSQNFFTASDERIIHKLEGLAMGETTSIPGKQQQQQQQQQKRSSNKRKQPQTTEDDGIELDVREYLSKSNLPISPDGAQRALVAIGRWTATDKQQRRRNNPNDGPEPWAPHVLELARSFADRESKRRKRLYRQCRANTDTVKDDTTKGTGNGGVVSKTKTTRRSSSSRLLEGRVDLTALPSVCIDARRTSFRDDAIGIRLRSSTGRKVLDSASKWEILVHITDVSDVFCANQPPSPGMDLNEEDDDNETKEPLLDLTPIFQAAESRGQSRYDLPFGPLHLMPPVALEALALVTKPDDTDDKGMEEVNRCVTVWAYINEKDGKIMDCGVERTLISTPLRLTFESASSILDMKQSNIQKGTPLYAERALVILASRLLSKWNDNQLRTDRVAVKRDERLRVRELIARETIKTTSMRDDGASGSFQRTKAHRLVDCALDLHGNVVSSCLTNLKAPIPRASGSGVEQGGRLGTAPLRRYIDGMAQRQSLAVLCRDGHARMTRSECVKANEIATKARNKMKNVRSVKRKDKVTKNDSSMKYRREDALRSLATHLSTLNTERQVVRAISSGRENEVVLMGIGLATKCGGVSGTLKPGIQVLVEVTRLDPKRGLLDIKLVAE